MMMLARQIGLLLSSVLLMALPASTLRGVVIDSSGALVPAATIVLKVQDGTTQTPVADGNGNYVFSGVSPGEYTVQRTARQSALTEPVPITLVSGTQTLNLRLSVAPVSERVEVGTDAPPTVGAEPESNATALVVRGSDLDALSDDSEDLMADLQALAGPSAGPHGGPVYVDGSSGGELPSKGSIREVRINQNPFSPEYVDRDRARTQRLVKSRGMSETL